MAARKTVTALNPGRITDRGGKTALILNGGNVAPRRGGGTAIAAASGIAGGCTSSGFADNAASPIFISGNFISPISKSVNVPRLPHRAG